MNNRLRLLLIFITILITLASFYVAIAMKRMRIEYMKTMDEDIRKKMRIYTNVSLIFPFLLIIITLIILRYS